MLFRREVLATPPEGPEQTHGPRHKKDPAPIREQQHERDQRRCDDHADRLSPALIIPMAVRTFFDREPFRDWRESQPEKPPPSPMPSKKAHRGQHYQVETRPCPAQASDQKIMMTVNPNRVPSTSINLPPAAYMIA
jgi:hypothetical protein